MTLLEALRSGSPGVRLEPLDGCTITDESDQHAVLHDAARGVVWEAQLSRCLTDAHPAGEAAWRRQAERDARALFDDDWAAREHPPGPFGEARARTADPQWSALVEAAAAEAAGGAALQAIHRRSYEPGREWVTGRLLVPLPAGTLEIAVHGIANQTGYRESALMMLLPQAGDPMEAIRRAGGQAYYDDPAHDHVFASHPLSCVRRALGAVRSAFARTAPPPVSRRGSREMPRQRARVVLPPRFEAMAGPPPGNLGPDLFVRVGLTATQITETFDVWRLDPGHGVRDPGALVAFAQDNVRRWSREGVTDIEVEARPGPDRLGCPTVDSEVRFVVAGIHNHSSMTWMLVEDGSLVRLSLNSLPAVPAHERRAELYEAAASLRLGTLAG